MVSSVSLKVTDGRIELLGYPEGATVRGLSSSPQTTELCRLMLFRSDLVRVNEWLGLAQTTDELHREALCSAALVKFCCCFDGTAGLRAKPLRRKDLFKGEDRQTFERLLQIRNKSVAHDEHLYPGEFPLIVLGTECSAIEALVLELSTPFSAMYDVNALRRLASMTLEWVNEEFESVAKEIVDSVNSLPSELRRAMRDSTPEFKINFSEPEDRFARR